MQQSQAKAARSFAQPTTPSRRNRFVTLKRTLLAALAVVALGANALAQDAETERGLEQYRAMMKEDPWSNPGYLDVDRGEALWTSPAGPKNASLEKCDLGQGPGKVEGAFARLLKYFADAGRVMYLETRILWCMERLQGISAAETVKRPH